MIFFKYCVFCKHPRCSLVRFTTTLTNTVRNSSPKVRYRAYLFATGSASPSTPRKHFIQTRFPPQNHRCRSYVSAAVRGSSCGVHSQGFEQSERREKAPATRFFLFPGKLSVEEHVCRQQGRPDDGVIHTMPRQNFRLPPDAKTTPTQRKEKK